MSYAILTTPKRTVIALIHTVVFLFVAALTLTGAPKMAAFTLRGTPAFSGAVALLAVYTAVATILLVLARLSRGQWERLYFLLCAASAALGVLRTLVGDHAMHGTQYLRVVLLAGAAVVGSGIWRLQTAGRQAEERA